MLFREGLLWKCFLLVARVFRDSDAGASGFELPRAAACGLRGCSMLTEPTDLQEKCLVGKLSQRHRKWKSMRARDLLE